MSADATKARRVASTDVDAPSRASERPAAPGSRRARREAERAAARAAATGDPDSGASTDTASTVTAEPVAASTVTAEPVAAEQTITAGATTAPEPKQSKAGRDLPAAIGVGMGLLAALGLGLFVFPYLLIALGCLVAGIGSWEVSRALKARTGIPIPLAPLLITSLALPLLAGLYGPVALSLGLTACLLLVVLWNMLEGRSHGPQSIGLSLLVVGWVPLLASFAFLIFQSERGASALLTVVLLVVSNDTFGYIVGATLGKHPMAARISPKKSWEGFAGSVLGASLVGIALCLWVLRIPWWLGLVLAVATVICATLGDFAESMVKRALGVKDMSNLLPGHGGMMDRLDSLLFAMPFGYAVVMLAEALG
ncbi:phosphatidate cytidylyltransferase [Pseudoglutamicibacter cumminsii]|uniref:phosphatidate cytidylyltransferase n=1 Tax=Pseudoglutamicibacter cumminsii TaxID=156979 RepID=UPI0030844D3C|nr:phosphatidate cytidylyltransferase [Pseudoglutamicibacter cumminsii]